MYVCYSPKGSYFTSKYEDAIRFIDCFNGFLIRKYTHVLSPVYTVVWEKEYLTKRYIVITL